MSDQSTPAVPPTDTPAVPPQDTAAEPTPPTQGLKIPDAAPPVSPLENQEFLAKLGAEALSTGDLSADSYEALAKAGIPKAVAQQYVQGQLAQHRQATEQIFTQAGGKEAVDAAVAWAAANLPQSTIDALNAQLSDPNPEVVLNTIKGLQARAGSGGGSFAPGKSGGNVGHAAYESEQQMHADQRNPLYFKDPAFRATVESRLKAAVQLGKIGMNDVIMKGF